MKLAAISFLLALDSVTLSLSLPFKPVRELPKYIHGSEAGAEENYSCHHVSNSSSKCGYHVWLLSYFSRWSPSCHRVGSDSHTSQYQQTEPAQQG